MSDRGRIVVAGAINTDLVASMIRAPEAGETVTGTSFDTFGGGKAANQAVAAARNEVDVVLIGVIGNDTFGAQRRTELLVEGIDCDYVRVDPESTSGVALIFLDQSGENRITYIPGATLGIKPGDCEEAVRLTAPQVVLASNEAPPGSLHALFSAARIAGTTVIFNATPDPEAARDLLSLTDVLIVNRQEANAILNARAHKRVRSAVDMLDALSELGAPSVVITSGAHGAYGRDSEGTFHCPARKVDAVDTTGAGDTFAGVFASELVRGTAFRGAVERATVASAISVTGLGARASIPSRSAVTRLLASQASQQTLTP